MSWTSGRLQTELPRLRERVGDFHWIEYYRRTQTTCHRDCSSARKLECFTVHPELERDFRLNLKGGISGEGEERVLLQWRKNLGLRFSIFGKANNVN